MQVKQDLEGDKVGAETQSNRVLPGGLGQWSLSLSISHSLSLPPLLS